MLTLVAPDSLAELELFCDADDEEGADTDLDEVNPISH
jgi:hypothetical protein